MYAQHAVILAELFVEGESKGPHLFWAEIADRQKDDQGNFIEGSRPVARDGVVIDSLPKKTVMMGLDNAEITFKDFRIPRTALLNRFCSLEPTEGSDKKSFIYKTNLPKGVPRMLDLLIFRLLTGRIQLSEGTVAHAQYRLRTNWAYCQQRELWRGRKPKGKMMSEMPLIKAAYRDYGRTLAIINNFIANTREVVADSIRQDGFTYDTVEATCMCKYLGTGFGVDCVSALRKLMGARALQSESALDKESFLPNATSAAEGDNTIMELKVVQDIFRGRTSMIPLGMILRVCQDARGRSAVATYFAKLARGTFMGKKAIGDGQLLRDIAWARAHIRVIDVWLKTPNANRDWLESYEKVLMVFPMRLQC
jgi:acyl-CoA oxidase